MPRASDSLRALRRAGIALAPALFTLCCEPDDAELGLLGEELAARHLAGRGWRILGRRVASAGVEVDLLVERGGQRAVVEVKAARGGRGRRLAELRFRPGHRLDPRLLLRLRRAARSLRCERARVDLVEVLIAPRSARAELLHHADLRRPLP